VTLAQFKQYLAKGEIHYYIDLGSAGGGGGGPGLSNSASGTSEIASWVASHFKSETVGGVTLYVL
jgi:hypothetical protein